MWHPDVRFFRLSVKGQPKAYFYLDPYSRPEEKRGGAWMAEVRHGFICRLRAAMPNTAMLWMHAACKMPGRAVKCQVDVEVTLRSASDTGQCVSCRCAGRASCLRRRAPKCGCPSRTW